jgi:serine/threonine protein kinase/WD40 repeat protein
LTRSGTPSLEETLFADALAQPDRERGAFLAKACGTDVAQLARITVLIAEHERTQTLLASAPRIPPGSLHEEKAGDRIGRYKLLQKIGEGGCGMVWMAEQEEPIRRRVALKVIKLGMDTKSVLARFEAERQALAMMDHPNIAKVLDGGATETGRPFFVMELVRGIPITRYCDENHLTPIARLELFITVCHAVQHAHEKAIIHRDLKPANILVTLHDGVPVPKVIDFGIAKATQGRLTDATLFTAFEQFIGTPVYMSPEQAEMSGMDVDTRSDIYSLGVLLYELLTGQPPFDPKSFASAGVDEIRHHIREDEPPKPSTRLRTLGEAERMTVARHRGTALAQLSLLLRGDLDWIVMKCLEKDRTRRYDTANGLIADIERHLRNEPVIARPPSSWYLLQKLVRRHRVGFAAAGAVIAALVAGLGISVFSLVNERTARERAVAAEREQIRLRELAQQAQANAEAQELAARQSAYASDMNLLQQNLTLGNLGRARELLNRHRPIPGGRDLRGWEWRYLWQLCQGDPHALICRLPESIKALAVSADASWIAAGAWNGGGLVLRNVRTGDELRPPVGREWVTAAFSPTEPMIAIGGTESTNNGASVHFIALWNLKTHRTEQRLEVAGRCLSLNFSTDGKTLVASIGSPEHAITLLRIPGMTKLSACAARQPFAYDRYSFAVSADLKFAAHQLGSNQIRVINLPTGEERWTATVADEVACALAFSPDGKILASGAGFQDGAIRLWDGELGTELGRLEGHRAWVSDLVFWPDGKTLGSASADHSIRLWDVSNRQLLKTISGHTGEVWRLALLRDKLVSGGKDGTVNIWDPLAPLAFKPNLTIPGEVFAWHFSPDSSFVRVIDAQGNVAEWRGSDFQEGHHILNTGALIPNSFIALFCPTEPLIAVGSENGVVRVWDLGRRRISREINLAAGLVLPVCYAQRGQRLIIFSVQTGRFHEWDLKSGNELASWDAPEGSYSFSLALSPDEMTALMIGPNGGTIIRDMRTGQSTSCELSIGGPVRHPRFSPDGQYFAAASAVGYEKLWHMATRQEAATLSGFLLGVHSVAFSPDGARLATASGGLETIKLWDVQSQQPLLTREGKGSMFRPTEFSPDGNVLGSISQGYKTLHLWRAPTWAQIEAVERAKETSGTSR